ncbi:MAG: alpha/beta fold hydrolase [Chloroflexi bacterium]|nr:alpha/beta fold hydrolase [Chloroflexota bacterium]
MNDPTPRPLFPSAVRLDRRFELAALQLQVADWPGRAGPVVCLPSMSGVGCDFDALAERIAPAWRVLALDLRGRGGSSAAGSGMGYQVHVADSVALLEQLGVEQAVVLGVGFGALIAALLAAWHPVLVGRLALVEADDSTAVARELRVLRDAPPRFDRVARAIRCPTVLLPLGSDLVSAVPRWLEKAALG